VSTVASRATPKLAATWRLALNTALARPVSAERMVAKVAA